MAGPSETGSPSVQASWDLENLAGSKGLIEWTSDQFEPVRGLRVAEVGAGIGTFTSRLLAGGALEVLALEPDPECLEILRPKFESEAEVEVAGQEVPGSSALAAAGFDLVLCQNVLEHVDDDRAAFREMVDALRPGGRIFLLVPAFPGLYGSLDRSYGHLRRYRPEDLRDLAAGTDLEAVRVRFFNALAIVGWWVRCQTGATGIGRRSLAVYELLLRLWRPIEERVRVPFGISLILEARKPGNGSDARQDA